MNDDLVSHNNDIIDFRNDVWITSNRFQGYLDGLVLRLVGWFPLGFRFDDRDGHVFFLIEMDIFRSFCFGREEVLGGADPSTVGETMLYVFAGDRMMVFQKIPYDAEIGTIKFMRFRNTRDGRRGKIKTDRKLKSINILNVGRCKTPIRVADRWTQLNSCVNHGSSKERHKSFSG